MPRFHLLIAAAVLAFAAGAAGAAGTGTARDQAYEDMVAAENALRRAEAAKAAGEEPLPGERLGLVNGKSRLGPDYWARQERLERAVAAAQKRFEDSRRRWNDLR
jgi:hypothetical protein